MYQSKFSSDISNTGRSMGHGIYTSDVVKKVWPTETAINHPFWGWKHTHLWSSCCHGLPFTCLCHRQILVEQEDNYMDISWFRYRWTATFFVDLYPYSFYIYICTCICTMTQRCGNGWHLKTKFNIINGGLRHGVLLHRIQSISAIVYIRAYKLHGLCILYTSWHHTTAWH